MRIGKEKHEKILTETIQQLKKEGFILIRLDGKSPTAIAIKDNVSYAINIFCDANKPKTLTFLEDCYHMFDKIIRISYSAMEKRKDAIDRILTEYTNNGFNIIKTGNKSPDAIAHKNDCMFAVEVIGIREGYTPKRLIKNKEFIYNMFDGIMIKTFFYESDVVFTETYGSNKGERRIWGDMRNVIGK